jgi:trimethylamine--corrinoid protein Co-methyltransferase
MRPGAPFIYGAGAGAFDMRASVDAYGSPEVFAGNNACCELAADYRLPSWSYAGHSDSSVLDEQWSLDSAVATMYGALSRATLLHDVGYLESGRACSLAAMVLGDELCGFARAFASALEVSDETLLLDEIDAVGPGGTHLGRNETRRRYRDFWHAGLLEHQPYDRWASNGGATLGERTRRRALELLSREPSLVLPAATARALEGVIAAARLDHARPASAGMRQLSRHRSD